MHKTQLPALANQPPSEVAATLRRDRKLSTFLTLAAEQPDEARANLPAYLRAALPILVEDEAARCAPATGEQIAAALSKTLSTGIGGPMSDAERREWQITLADDMRDIPADLALEALRQARRSCTRAGEVLPFVVGYVEDYPARRRARLQSLIKLADVAGVSID